ncbi:MAG: transporter substrate-binding domain-containing protein [Saprospiraceae bacterium]|nr:transporter substrate-binding domain-containing protein [Saprospiraceae bacterium]
MKICKNGHTNSSDARFCETCGEPLSGSSAGYGTVRVRSWVKFALGILILAGLTYFILDYINKPSDTPVVAEKGGNIWEQVQKSGVLRVGVEPDGAPLNWLEGNKRYGLDFELINAVAKEMGIDKVEFNEKYFYEDLPVQAQEGTFDVFMGGYVPDPEIENTLWSDSYLDFGLCLIVPKGSAIENINQLKGKRVGLYEGDNVAKEWVEKNVAGVKTIKSYVDDQDKNWLDCINRDEVDAVIYDYPFTSEEIKEFDNLKIVQLNLNKSKYAIGVPGKQNYEFLAKLNSALKVVQESPAYGQIIQKYLRSDKVEVAKAKESKTERVYVIKVGDTLGSIAASQLGSSSRWTDIYELNMDRLPNPHLIFEDNEILLPKQ